MWSKVPAFLPQERLSFPGIAAWLPASLSPPGIRPVPCKPHSPGGAARLGVPARQNPAGDTRGSPPVRGPHCPRSLRHAPGRGIRRFPPGGGYGFPPLSRISAGSPGHTGRFCRCLWQARSRQTTQRRKRRQWQSHVLLGQTPAVKKPPFPRPLRRPGIGHRSATRWTGHWFRRIRFSPPPAPARPP